MALVFATACALALAACVAVPSAAPSGALVKAAGPSAATKAEEPAASPEEPITAAEIAAEPMFFETEPPVELATGGDPDAVTNATLQLRSEYGDLWERIRQGFTLHDLDTPLVKTAEEWYEARPDYVARMIERSRRYLYYIVAEVERRNMPMEIALLPMIESAYNPMALSRSRASGIWQFIPSTGKLYGMQQNWWLDDRRNVVAARYVIASRGCQEEQTGRFGDGADDASNNVEWTSSAAERHAVDGSRQPGTSTLEASIGVRLGIVFDKAILKNGQAVPLNVTIQALAAAAVRRGADRGDRGGRPLDHAGRYPAAGRGGRGHPRVRWGRALPPGRRDRRARRAPLPRARPGAAGPDRPGPRLLDGPRHLARVRVSGGNVRPAGGARVAALDIALVTIQHFLHRARLIIKACIYGAIYRSHTAGCYGPYDPVAPS